MSAFLSISEVVELTDRRAKSKQIETLRKMGLPFFVNASGHPVVPHSAIDGKKEATIKKRQWDLPD